VEPTAVDEVLFWQLSLLDETGAAVAAEELTTGALDCTGATTALETEEALTGAAALVTAAALLVTAAEVAIGAAEDAGAAAPPVTPSQTAGPGMV
jgi:hypothetical protein